MASFADNVALLWTWQIQAICFANDLAETALASSSVIATRMPLILEAAQNPISADRVELRRMVTEKVAAFGTSRRSISFASRSVEQAANANAGALGTMAGGGWLSTSEWIRLGKANIEAAASLTALPAAVLSPLHKGATANDRRLKSQKRNRGKN